MGAAERVPEAEARRRKRSGRGTTRMDGGSFTRSIKRKEEENHDVS